MADLQKIVDDLSGLTVLEAAELAKLLEEKWGVSAAAAVAVAGPAAAAAAPAEEKTEFTVVLAAAGRAGNRHGRSRGDAPLLFEELGEFGRFEHGQAREVVNNLL